MSCAKYSPPGENNMVLHGFIHLNILMDITFSYAGDVMYVRALDQNIIVLNSKEAAIELLERRSAIYSHRPRLIMANEL